jgi:hypothetical protein
LLHSPDIFAYPAKRKQALLESNLPRDNRCGEEMAGEEPFLSGSSHCISEPPMPQKLNLACP